MASVRKIFPRKLELESCVVLWRSDSMRMNNREKSDWLWEITSDEKGLHEVDSIGMEVIRVAADFLNPDAQKEVNVE